MQGILPYLVNALLYGGLAYHFWRTRWLHAGASTATQTSSTLEHYATLVPLGLHTALLARSMVEMDGSKIRASRRAVTTPIAIVIPLSVAHAVLAAASTMKGISARVGPRSPKRAASSRA